MIGPPLFVQISRCPSSTSILWLVWKASKIRSRHDTCPRLGWYRDLEWPLRLDPSPQNCIPVLKWRASAQVYNYPCLARKTADSAAHALGEIYQLQFKLGACLLNQRIHCSEWHRAEEIVLGTVEHREIAFAPGANAISRCSVIDHLRPRTPSTTR